MALQLLFLLKVFFFFSAADNTVPASIYDVKMTATDGSTIDFSAFKGMKILIVNTPIEADNSRQYADLETLSKRYKDKLVVIGCLADDFLTAPGSRKNPSNTEKHYNVTFPLTTKVYVRGDNMSPIFRWLTEKKYNGYMDSEVQWDFQKYLVNEKGELIAVFEPNVKAYAPQLLAAIEK